jgi:hypothetical protein
MVYEKLPGKAHEAVDQIGALAPRKIGANGFTGNVMGWRHLKFGFTPLPDQQMAVTDTRIKRKCL